MHTKNRFRTPSTFTGEKHFVADMIERFLRRSDQIPFITAVEGLSLDLFAESSGSATIIILSQVVQDLTMRNMTDLRKNLESLVTYLREDRNEAIVRSELVEHILRSAPRSAGDNK